MLQISAPAKINLSLEVTGRRPDGFHDLVSVMQEVTLADELQIGTGHGLSLETDSDHAPQDQDLALRAAAALRSQIGGTVGATIQLRKRVPVGAGLGGGSSDAAACLVALNELWKADLGCTGLTKLAAGLGSDVPFFLTGGTALTSGRGERVVPLPEPRESWYVLVNPGFHVSTRRVFEALESDDWTSGQETLRLAGDISRGGAAGIGVNNLQQALFRLYPGAETCFRSVERLASGRVFVSGSGPTVVAAPGDRGAAQQIAQAAADLGYWARVVRNYPTEGRQLPCRV